MPTRHPPVEGSWSAGQSPAARRLAVPLWEFPDTEVGRWTLALDLRHWISDGLMALLFFVVGLEIKRELVVGELRSWRNAALPVLAALGGMVVPAVVFLSLNSGVEATIAGVALGLLMPTRPLVRHLSVSLGGDDIQPSAPAVRWVRLHVQETITAGVLHGSLPARATPGGVPGKEGR